MNGGSNNNDDVWVYHELQEALLCGQHALNNLVQDCVFSPESLAGIAHELDEMELRYMSENNEGGTKSKDYLQRLVEPSGNVDPHGNFSIQVLRAALQNKFDIELPNIKQEGFATQEPTTMEGFICNRASHWFAIRKINGRYWNLNSTKEVPELVSHFKLATELEKLIADGYAVFCVAVDHPLPPACLSAKEMEVRKSRMYGGVKGNWWREADLLNGSVAVGGKPKSGSENAWKNVGSGMRLDGKSTVAEAAPLASLEGMTEEEQLRFAMAASLEPASLETSHNNNNNNDAASSPAVPDVEVPPEPAAGTPGSVRIQFRLPSKPRIVRRFMETDIVAVIIKFCQEEEGGKNLDLKYGYPPKDLKALATQTIGEAKLAGESIQGRCI